MQKRTKTLDCTSLTFAAGSGQSGGLHRSGSLSWRPLQGHRLRRRRLRSNRGPAPFLFSPFLLLDP